MNWKIGEQIFSIPKDVKIEQFEYIIGVDTYDEDKSAYCLMRRSVGTKHHVEVILAKSMPNTKEFQKEVDDLAKYFDAVKISDE